MQVIVDSREQNPFWTGRFCFKTALNVGDYTTYELLNKFHVERKSLVDLYGTITKGNVRFKKEILRAKHAGIRLEVVIEGTKKDFKDKKFYGGAERLVSGETLIKIINTIQRNHNLIVHWCKDRESARKKTKRLLKQNEKRNKKSNPKKIKTGNRGLQAKARNSYR